MPKLSGILGAGQDALHHHDIIQLRDLDRAVGEELAKLVLKTRRVGVHFKSRPPALPVGAFENEFGHADRLAQQLNARGRARIDVGDFGVGDRDTLDRPGRVERARLAHLDLDALRGLRRRLQHRLARTRPLSRLAQRRPRPRADRDKRADQRRHELQPSVLH